MGATKNEPSFEQFTERYLLELSSKFGSSVEIMTYEEIKKNFPSQIILIESIFFENIFFKKLKIYIKIFF